MTDPTEDAQAVPAVPATEDPAAETSTESAAPVRALRKKRVPDTSYLNAPKVVPGGAVVCFSRLPHGFFETELREYLSQFGEVTRLRLSRNPRTGASRHYAFVEFRHAEVARIVVETMHNYLLAGHVLQCSLVPEERIHSELWKGANKKFAMIPWRKLEAKRYNASMEKTDKVAQRDQAKLKASQRKLAELGIEYDLSGVLSGEL